MSRAMGIKKCGSSSFCVGSLYIQAINHQEITLHSGEL